jgi:hypothetical protein
MKRLLLSAVVAIALVGTIEAQTKFWVGGSFSISSSDHDPNKDHSFILMPEFGYRINDNWAVGGMLGFRSFTTETGDFEQKTNSTSIVPFARYYVGGVSMVRFFAQGSLPMIFHGGDVSYNSVGLIASPGLEIAINEKWGFNMLMPPVLSLVNTDGNTDFYIGLNDGYNIEDYILKTSISFIYKF